MAEKFFPLRVGNHSKLRGGFTLCLPRSTFQTPCDFVPCAYSASSATKPQTPCWGGTRKSSLDSPSSTFTAEINDYKRQWSEANLKKNCYKCINVFVPVKKEMRKTACVAAAPLAH